MARNDPPLPGEALSRVCAEALETPRRVSGPEGREPHAKNILDTGVVSHDLEGDSQRVQTQSVVGWCRTPPGGVRPTESGGLGGPRLDKSRLDTT
jgi:hypothetical protein